MRSQRSDLRQRPPDDKLKSRWSTDEVPAESLSDRWPPLLQGSITIWSQSPRPGQGPRKRKFLRPYCTARFYFGVRYPQVEPRLF